MMIPACPHCVQADLMSHAFLDFNGIIVYSVQRHQATSGRDKGSAGSSTAKYIWKQCSNCCNASVYLFGTSPPFSRYLHQHPSWDDRWNLSHALADSIPEWYALFRQPPLKYSLPNACLKTVLQWRSYKHQWGSGFLNGAYYSGVESGSAVLAARMLCAAWTANFGHYRSAAWMYVLELTCMQIRSSRMQAVICPAILATALCCLWAAGLPVRPVIYLTESYNAFTVRARSLWSES